MQKLASRTFGNVAPILKSIHSISLSSKSCLSFLPYLLSCLLLFVSSLIIFSLFLSPVHSVSLSLRAHLAPFTFEISVFII